MPPPMVTREQERATLEECMKEARRRLEHCRAEGNTLEADLTEADINRMLDEWERVNAQC